MLSPAIAAAQHTTAPMSIAAAGPDGFPLPRSTNRSREEVRIVAIVTPEIGLLDDPTTPAMRSDGRKQEGRHNHQHCHDQGYDTQASDVLHDEV
jgi:hypothetical protein